MVIMAFTVNILLGNICMMPMSIAMAADMPMHHDEAMETVMAPMNLMSSVRCDHCLDLAKEHPAPMDRECAGNCLSQANDIGAAVVQNSAPSLFLATLPFFITETRGEVVQSFVEANAPPPRANPTRTIVLLQ